MESRRGRVTLVIMACWMFTLTFLAAAARAGRPELGDRALILQLGVLFGVACGLWVSRGRE